MAPRGRPVSLEMDIEAVTQLLKQGRTVTQIAGSCGVSRSWLTLKLKAAQLLPSNLKHAETPETLLREMEKVLKDYPQAGLTIITGILRSKNIVSTRAKLQQCYRILAPERILKNLSRHGEIKRKPYYVPYTHAVWHIDTHLKLRDYGFVFHGGIDGKSRLLVFLEASVSNSSEANLRAFMKGVNRYGVPVRVRGDKGGENIEVAAYMLEARGENCSAYIAGRSVHNVRIERFWRDLGTQVVSTFKGIFEALRQEGVLRLHNAVEVALLHHVFLPVINSRVDEFRVGWNNHKVSSERNRTPIIIAGDHPLPKDKTIPVPQDIEVELSVELRTHLDQFTSNSQLFDCSAVPAAARQVVVDLINSDAGNVASPDPVTEYKRLRSALN